MKNEHFSSTAFAQRTIVLWPLHDAGALREPVLGRTTLAKYLHSHVAL
jgi:hypothetical protein